MLYQNLWVSQRVNNRLKLTFRLGIIFSFCLFWIFLLNKIGHIRENGALPAQSWIQLTSGNILRFKQSTGHLPIRANAFFFSNAPSNQAIEHDIPAIAHDPWGQPIIYIAPAKYGHLEFDLYSIGKNGIDEHGAGDDISNWNGYNHWYYFELSDSDVLSILFNLILLLLYIYLRPRHEP